jgi:hypothetical protein
VDVTIEFTSGSMATLAVAVNVEGVKGTGVIGAISGEVTEQRRSDTIAERERGAVQIGFVRCDLL